MKAIDMKRIFWFFFWLVIIGLSLYFYVMTFVYYSQGETPENFKLGFWESKIWFVGHITGATCSLLLGPLQFWNKFRTKFMKWHRTAGKIFIIGSLVAGVCAFRITLFYSCVPCRVSLGILSVIWMFCTAAAWWAVKQKNIKAHKQFMVRSYTAALAFVFIRLFPLIGYELIFPFMELKTDRRTAAEWLCWVIPFLIIEFYMVWWPSLNAKLKPVK
jgi:uncharacterized membrane protein YozB (DUF420 family)